MKKIIIISMLAVSLLSSFSVTAFAAPWDGGLVQCGKADSAVKYKLDENGNPTNIPLSQAQNCQFSDVINLINTLVQSMIYIAMPLAAVSFAYAGWIYLTAGGDTGKVKKAHDIFLSVGIGFALVLSAWLLFKFIATTFLSDSYQTSTYLKQ